MVDIELVIKISEKTVNDIKDNAMFAKPIADHIKWDVTSAIVNGTPLPKGHGNLKDMNDLCYKSRYGCKGNCDHLHACNLYRAPTIIEADEETDDYYRGAQEEY